MTNNGKKVAVPGTLSHYTTIGGFTGILGKDTFRASNVSFLNDRRELLHALEAVQGAIKQLSKHTNFLAWEAVIRKVVAQLENGKIPDTYAICFCRDDDNLSQWRGYGGNVQGVCLTFKKEPLRRAFRELDARLYEVAYSNKSTIAKLRDALGDELEDIAELDEIVGFSGEKEKYAEMFKRISLLLPKFKHLGFKDEREWRAVVQRQIDATELKFRPSGNKIVPYIELKFEKKLPLTSVRVGPGHDQELTIQSLNVFLKSRGYPDVEIKKSEVPFRPGVE